MRLRILLSFLLLMLVANLVAAEGRPVVIGQADQLRSTVLDEERTYAVSLPASYVPLGQQRYPVLYVLDGQQQFPLAVAATRFLSAQGEIPEMIVVGIDSTVRVRDFTQTDWPEAWIGGGGAGNFAQFLGDELFPRIEDKYRTDGYRILMGHSAGGQFALHALGMHPELFRAHLVLAPSLDWDDRLPQRELQQALDGIEALPAFAYFAYGDDLGQALADDKALETTLSRGGPKGFRAASRHFPDESHSGIVLLALVDGLRSLYAGYELSEDALQGVDLPFVEQHYKDVSKSLGWPIAVPEGVINALGYAALESGRLQDATALFLRNTTAYPDSANAWDSLAEAYEKAGQLQEAAAARDAYERLARPVR